MDLKLDRIYCDYAATTPLNPAARAAMETWLTTEFGNPSSTHREGRRAKEAIDAAREIVSGAMGCLFAEVQFTSSGTEAANAGILGVALQNLGGPRKRIILGAAEHHCVLHTATPLRRLGYDVEFLPPTPWGSYDASTLATQLDTNVLLVSLMHANNETGAVTEIAALANQSHAVGALVHTDAVQTFLSHQPPLIDLGADLISISAHKVYGPKAVGALYTRAGLEIAPLIVGGGQEREQRGGTENVAGIVGFGVAVADWKPDSRCEARDEFKRALNQELPGQVAWTVPPDASSLDGHAHFRIPDCPAESMLIALDQAGVAASAGAACSSGSLEPSHVLLACGFSPVEASEGLRFTFGRHSTPDEAREAAIRTAAVARRILSD